MGTLSDKTALVTGASRGIGRAIAKQLARDGARVGVHYGTNDEAANEVVSAIEVEGGEAVAIKTELGLPGDAEALWAAFDDRFDGLDILVNNAGIGMLAPIEKTEEEDFDKLVAINFKAQFFITQQAIGRLRDGGRIVNLSSATTRIALPLIAAYSATKGAINSMTLTLAEALAPRGITVNAVAPGIIETDLNSWLAVPEMKAMAESWSAFGRTGTPADVSDLVAFLVSDGARWTTGQIIDVSGGSALGNGPAARG